MSIKISYSRLLPLITFPVIVLQLCSCTAINIVRFYDRNKPLLDSIHGTFQQGILQKPFSLEFTDQSFDRVSVELLTDSIKYIYEFRVGEPRMQDTLVKFGMDTRSFNTLITQMRSARCTWINQLDYYSEGTRHYMTYISLWPRAINSPLVNRKYYILTYFNERQYFDDRGNLLTGRRRRRIRKINTEVFKRINDRVCYTISDRFR